MVKKPTVMMFVYLMLLATIGFFSSDLYLPAFPAIREGFHASSGLVQLTLSLYLLGLAVGQLFYGPISDSFGRKPTLLIGSVVYILGSFACFLSPNIDVFLVARIFQSLGACAAAAVWQSVVIDKYGESGSLYLFSLIIPLISLSPSLAPVLGGFMTDGLGWPSIFLLLTILGVVMLLLTGFYFQESLPKAMRTNNHFTLKKIAANYFKLLSSRFFMGYIGLICLTNAAFFIYITGVPFIYKDYIHLTASEIGFVFIPQTVMFMLAGFTSKWMVRKIGTHRSLQISIWLAVLGSVLLVIFLWAPPHHIALVLCPFLLIAFANGVIYPVVMAVGLNRFPELAGIASGLSGFLMLFVAFAGTLVLSATMHLGIISMSVIMLLVCVSAVLWYQILRQERLE